MKRTDSKAGSALILAVVLTSLLAVVGMIFIMAARVDRIATSSIAENRELNFAVETVIAKVSQELALDVPGMPKGIVDYYDYPDEENAWLASLEPYEETGQYYWKQVSDVTGFLDRENWDTQAIKIDTDAIIEDHNKIDLDRDGNIKDQTGAKGGQLADADGDGVADSKWIELDNITSGKGKPVYAAIRVIDNGGMLNVNTAYKFDANETDPNLIDGSNQLQIDLMALSWRPGVTSYQAPEETDLLKARANNGDGVDPVDLVEYEEKVVWRYYLPEDKYTPFDISDELELRNRFLLNHTDIDTRLEEWGGEFRKQTFSTPVEPGELDEWFISAYDDGRLDPNYAYRHIATTYNIDRIIKPDRLKMVNINRQADVQNLYDVLISSIAPDIGSGDRQRIKERFAQLAANMADYVDGDTDVTVFKPEGITYYGFEAQPFISEIAVKIDTFPDINPSYFAVELYNPFNAQIRLENFELELYDNDGAIGSVTHTVTFDSEDVLEPGRCFVIANNLSEFNIYGKTDENTKQDPELKFFGGWIPPMEAAAPRDRRRAPGEGQPPRPTSWQKDTSLRLKQKAENGEWIYIDKQFLDRSLAPANKQWAYGRDARDWHIVYPTLREDTGVSRSSLGRKNDIDPGEFRDQKHNFSFFLPRPISPDPPLREKTGFVTVGDITRILTIGNNTGPDQTIGEQLEQTSSGDEDTIRLGLQNPYHRNVFQYLTVFDPTADGIDNDDDGKIDDDTYDDKDHSEWKISGRININTAPWFVIKQLPWVTDKIARAIVAYRDKLENPVDYSGPTGRERATGINNIREDFGFESIGELNFVIGGNDEYSIAEYALDGEDLKGFPDLSTNSIGGEDGITDDFEERDIIFSRISNLVTVRSDVFTAYILVRIGADGPQKRVIAILDRSNVYTANAKVKLVALHPVPDPR